MKKSVLFPALFFLSSICFGQYEEFRIYPNGLIYRDQTMDQLRLIVDSLNLQFRTCDLDRVYYSKYQAKAHFVSLEGGDIQKAKRDMENDIPFDDFVRKYAKATVDKDLLVVKFKYRNYEDEDVVVFGSVVEEHEISIEGQPEVYIKPVKGSWVFSYREESDYWQEE